MSTRELTLADFEQTVSGEGIVLVDFWSMGPRYQAKMLWGVIVIAVVLFVPFAIRHFSHVFGG